MTIERTTGLKGLAALARTWWSRGIPTREAAVAEGNAPSPAAAVGVAPVEDQAWPDDPHEVPSWVLAQEARAAARGYALHQPRTRAEYEAAVARCTASLPADDGLILPPLPPAEAAAGFVAWCRASQMVGQFTSEQLSELYAAHVSEGNRKPAPDNLFRAALKKVPGVSLVDVSKGFSKTGKRIRSRMWTILPEAEIPAVSTETMTVSEVSAHRRAA